MHRKDPDTDAAFLQFPKVRTETNETILIKEMLHNPYHTDEL